MAENMHSNGFEPLTFGSVVVSHNISPMFFAMPPIEFVGKSSAEKTSWCQPLVSNVGSVGVNWCQADMAGTRKAS
jgi:hypothetical protein